MDSYVACSSLLEGTMTRNRTKVWDLNYVTVIMSDTTKWITHPPSRCPSGRTLGPGKVLVGHQACLGHGGGAQPPRRAARAMRRCTGHHSIPTARRSTGQRPCASPTPRCSRPNPSARHPPRVVGRFLTATAEASRSSPARRPSAPPAAPPPPRGLGSRPQP
jgi:hypothetical protein